VEFDREEELLEGKGSTVGREEIYRSRR